MDFIHEQNRIYVSNEFGENIAEVTYSDISPDTVVIDHTYVDPLLRGQGVASRLVELAYEDIKQQGKKTYASCPYAAGWFKRHPEKRDILLL